LEPLRISIGTELPTLRERGGVLDTHSLTLSTFGIKFTDVTHKVHPRTLQWPDLPPLHEPTARSRISPIPDPLRRHPDIGLRSQTTPHPLSLTLSSEFTSEHGRLALKSLLHLIYRTRSKDTRPISHGQHGWNNLLTFTAETVVGFLNAVSECIACEFVAWITESTAISFELWCMGIYIRTIW